jgi:hypothetical protein
VSRAATPDVAAATYAGAAAAEAFSGRRSRARRCSLRTSPPWTWTTCAGLVVAALLRSLPQMTDDSAQYFLWNSFNLLFAPRHDEDSPHRSVDWVMPSTVCTTRVHTAHVATAAARRRQLALTSLTAHSPTALPSATARAAASPSTLQAAAEAAAAAARG